MKRINLNLSFIQISYLVIYLILFSVVILVPAMVTGSVHFTKKLVIEEEIVEGSLLGILFLLSVVILNLYRNETSKQKELLSKISNEKKSVEERLDESFRYIGQVNVQIQQIRSIFNDKGKFPETKNDFKKTLSYFSERVFGIVNANWVLFRIINTNSRKTIKEQYETRIGYVFDYPHVSNKSIVEDHCCPPFTTIISNPQNLNLFVCCILPVDNINNDEKVFIQAITNEIAMLFIILNSSYYKKSNNELPGTR